MGTTLPPEERWRLLVPPGAVVVRAERRRYALAAWALRELPPGVRVAIVGGVRCGRLARRNGVTLERSYVVLPSLSHPVAVAMVAREPLRWFARSVLTVPPGTARLHGLKWLAVKVMRWRPGLLVHAPAGDRIVIGVRA
ncbi:MAG TPA: hypothetical protein VKB69_13675 [Micromonosporaceae bacterium]|nr:hypothetical protein [Micromonosporaceae bacterium]